MSYCRFSSDDYRSDVYAYETHGGWQLHVAARRHDLDLGQFGPAVSPEDSSDAWLARNMGLVEALRTATLVPIRHPEAGTSYCFDSPGELADKLDQLSREGFHVPAGVIVALRDEQADMDAAAERSAGAPIRVRP